ncbi:creatininase family protein [Paenibacillus protaetiae]|uniref:Creatininase family protein n=1 Tax=Paenibacillus protaetiae TaxID=2509456 RepID=A0A4P6EWA0_9BACL|nr:creatininase family protein [Paenibacillus protaetiae]QAY66453.1 creatininase family protein [Paenibacillus protaetiae]
MFTRYEGTAWESKFLPRLTRKQIGELPKEKALVVLSIGAVEQHGDHMPVMTDALIGEATLTEALEKLDPAEQVWVIPPISYGKSNEHIGIPGTISLSAATLAGIVKDIAASLQASGFRRLLLFNTHGGNMDLLNVISREIRIATGMMVFYLSPSSLDAASDLMAPEELEFGIHGGDYETSIAMHVKPDWVQEQYRVKEMPRMERFDYLTLESKIRFAWKMDDISASGILGDATAATAEKGRIIQERVTDILAKAFAELSRFEIDEFLQVK